MYVRETIPLTMSAVLQETLPLQYHRAFMTKTPQGAAIAEKA
jgi:hypothetical protein